MDEVRASRRLRITAGLNRGACVALVPGSITMLGSALDGDLVLADEGVAARHLALRADADAHADADGDALRVRVFDGGVHVGGVALAPLVWHMVKVGASIALDGSAVVLVLDAAADASASPAGPDRAGVGVGSGMGDDPHPGPLPHAGEGEEPGASLAVAPGRRRRWAIAGVTSAALAAAGAALAFVATPGTREVPTRDALQRLLADVPASAAIRVNDVGGVLRFEGIADAAGVQALRQALIEKQWSASVALQVVTPSQLVAATDATFRARGVHDARITHTGAGRVQVSNADPDDPAVQRAAADAKRDVPELAALGFAPYDKPKPPRAPVTDPGQRLTAIVHGATSYVATADGKRFLIGAVLPDGHVVRAIGAQGVELERDGQRSWLDF